MKYLLGIFSLLVTGSLFASPGIPIQRSHDRSKSLDTVTVERPGGCKIISASYTGGLDELKGSWWQSVYVGSDLLLYVAQDTNRRERSVALNNNTNAVALQIDSNLDGKTDLIVVSNPGKQELTDVLTIGADGKISHASVELFEKRQRILEINIAGEKKLEGAIKRAGEDFQKMKPPPE